MHTLHFWSRNIWTKSRFVILNLISEFYFENKSVTNNYETCLLNGQASKHDLSLVDFKTRQGEGGGRKRKKC